MHRRIGMQSLINSNTQMFIHNNDMSNLTRSTLQKRKSWENFKFLNNKLEQNLVRARSFKG